MFCGDTNTIDRTFSPPGPCPRCEGQSRSLESLLVSSSTVFVSSNYSTVWAIIGNSGTQKTASCRCAARN
jgi:hypothetical protein